jgi:nucleoside-diphosphate-sugar epimerase
MKILVTGGSGFLGKALCLRLHGLGHTVSYLSRSEAKELKALDIKWFQGDISNMSIVFSATKDQHAVFHTAALAGYWGKKEDFYLTNVTGTENVVKTCLTNNVPYLIYTSSPSVVFNGKDLENVNESIPFPEKHLCFYSETKCIAEKLVLENNNAGLKTIVLRPHLIWGPGDNHLVPRVIESARQGKLKIVGNGKNKVNLAYIDNVVEGHILAWQGLLNLLPCDGKCYFIDDDEPIELWPWVNHLLNKLNIPEVEKKISFKLAYRIGAVLEWFYSTFKLNGEPPMTRFVAVSLATHHYFDIGNAKRDFNYKTVISAEEALNRTIKDLLQRSEK